MNNIAFYPEKWIARCAILSPTQRGVFITLICEMYERMSPLNYDQKMFVRLCGCSSKIEFNKAIQYLKSIDLIIEIEDGIWSPIIDDFQRQGRKDMSRPSIPTDIRNRVLERDGNVCSYCGCTEGKFHLDHIHPWALGGEHSLENLTVACASCNLSKGSKTLEEWRGCQ